MGSRRRVLRGFVALVAVLVPARQRQRWREEWLAELWSTVDGGRPWLAVRRAAGAPRDAWSTRHAWPTADPRRPLDSVLYDLRTTLRSLRQRPAFTATAVILLAIGIGANAALFAAVDATLFEPLPWHEPDRIVAVYERRPAQPGRDRNTVSVPDFVDWKERATVFEALSFFHYDRFAFRADDQLPISLSGTRVSSEFFRALGVDINLGRDFTLDDDRPGAPPTVILSHATWRDLFGSDPQVLGRDVILDNEPHRVIGVLADTPAYYFESQVWTPTRLDRDVQSRGNHRYRVLGRLHAGVSVAAADAELDGIAHQLEAEYPDRNEGHYTAVHGFHEELGREGRAAMWAVWALAGVVLLIVCINLASLQIASASSRQREVAIRLAIGATRQRLFAAVLLESAVIAMAAAALGVAAATVTAELLVPPPPWRTSPAVDANVFGFALLLAFATTLVFGALPALRLGRGDVFGALAGGGRALGSIRVGLRSLLVAAEVALALVLVAGAGLLLRSALALATVETGFDDDRVIAAQVELSLASYPDDAARGAFFEELLAAAGSLPGVALVGSIDTLPLSGSSSSSVFRIEGREQDGPADRYATNTHRVTPGYFASMGIDLHAGRGITAQDIAGAEPVVVISDAMAQRYFPGGDALGSRISIDRDWHRIVGIVGGVRHHTLRAAPDPESYFAAAQTEFPTRVWVVMRTDDLDAVAQPLRARVAALDPTLPVANIVALRTLADRSRQSTTRVARVLSSFGVLAVVIATMGLYGVISFTVGQRRREMALRVALGSSTQGVVGLVFAQGLRLIAAGLAVGLIVSVSLAPLLADLVFGVAANDAWSLAAAVAVLALAAAAATLVPALRAARVHPASALRAS